MTEIRFRYIMEMAEAKVSEEAKMRCLGLIILIGAPVILLWGDTLDYPPAEFSFYKENGFDRIKAPRFSLRGEPGNA